MKPASKFKRPQRRLIQVPEKWTHEHIHELGIHEVEYNAASSDDIINPRTSDKYQALKILYNEVWEETYFARWRALSVLFEYMAGYWSDVTNLWSWARTYKGVTGRLLTFGRHLAIVDGRLEIRYSNRVREYLFLCLLPHVSDWKIVEADADSRCSPLIYAEIIALALTSMEDRPSRAIKVYLLRLLGERPVWSEFNFTKEFFEAFRRGRVVDNGGTVSHRAVGLDDLVKLTEMLESQTMKRTPAKPHRKIKQVNAAKEGGKKQGHTRKRKREEKQDSGGRAKRKSQD